MKKALAFLILALVILTTFCIRGYFKITKANDVLHTYEGWVSHFDNHMTKADIPNAIDFAGESVPLHDLEIRQRYATVLNSNAYWLIPTIFKDPLRAKMFKDISLILKQEEVPSDFIYLAIAESQLLNKVSPRGAAGIWQIMPASGTSLGLEINQYVDERFDYIKSTYAACRFLKQSYAELGSWTLAAASYNMGIGGISRKVTVSGTDDYYALNLNKETTNYLYRIVAIKHAMMKDKIRLTSNSISYRILDIDTGITNLESFSNIAGCDYFLLKQFNPWLLGHELPKAEKKYQIILPNSSAQIVSYEHAESSSDTPKHLSIRNRIMSMFR
ncbi:murein transglycosylase [Bacteroidota bacterium]|nr:murein transglycosylase [Bacteroidota bacterium]